MKTVTSHSLEETQKIAHDWLKEISDSSKDSSKATVVGLSGHLGAGKTAFVKAVAKEFGIKESVTSPTFVLMKIYDIDTKSNFNNWKKLVHIDAYRLEKPEELKALKLEQFTDDRSNLIMVEWPENVGLKNEIQINMKALEKAGTIEIDFL